MARRSPGAPGSAEFPRDHRSGGDRTLALAVCATLFACYLAFALKAYVGAKGGYDTFGVLIGHDFVTFWTASALVHAGNVADIFNAETFNGWQRTLVGAVELPKADGTPSALLYPWLYPPTGLFPVLPLGFLPYFWAYAAWSVASVALFVWAALGARWRSGDGLALAVAPPTFACLLAGQNGLLTGALLVGGFRVLGTRPVLAGVLFGLMSFKPHLGLLVPIALLAARQWRAVAAAAVTVLVLYGASVAVFGVESWQAYLAGSATSHYDGLLGDAQGPFLKVSATPFIAARILGADAAGRIAVQLAFTAVVAGAVFAAFRRPVPADLRNAILLSAVLLASPFGYFYDLPSVAVAALIAYREALRTGFMPGERVAQVAAWLSPIVIVAVNSQGVPLGPVALGALFAYLCARAFQLSPSSRLSGGFPPPVRA